MEAQDMFYIFTVHTSHGPARGQLSLHSQHALVVAMGVVELDLSPAVPESSHDYEISPPPCVFPAKTLPLLPHDSHQTPGGLSY